MTWRRYICALFSHDWSYGEVTAVCKRCWKLEELTSPEELIESAYTEEVLRELVKR